MLHRTQDLLQTLAVPLGIALGVTLVLLIARRFLLARLEVVAGRVRIDALALPLTSLRGPTLLWCLALGLPAGFAEAPVPRRLAAWGSGVIAALVILSVTMVAATVASRSLQHFARRRQMGAALTGLGTTLSKALVFILGGLVILETLGVAISPLVAALGVGGIAIALALQDILSNFFAGIYLVLEKPVRVGDSVKLETGHEGTVVDIGWRTTRITMPPNSTVIVPNGKLAQGVLTVRDREERRAGGAVMATGGRRGRR